MDKDKSSGTGSGCIGLALELGVWVVSVTLVTVGAFVFLAGALTFTPSFDIRTIVPIIIAPVGIYVLIRVGRSILRDLRGP